jgi:hypothetical protein
MRRIEANWEPMDRGKGSINRRVLIAARRRDTGLITVNEDAAESSGLICSLENELVLSTIKEEMVVYIHLLQTLICRFCLSADLAINGHIIPDVLMNI